MTAINSKLRIDKLSRNITQLGINLYSLENDENHPTNPDNVIKCSLMMGILPILGKHYLLLI